MAGLRTQLRTECSAPECSEVIFSKVGVALTFTRVIARLPDHTGVDTRGRPGSGRSPSLDYMSIISEIRTCNHAQLHAIMHSCRSRAQRGNVKAPGCRLRAHRGRPDQGGPVARLGVSILGFPQVELLIPLGRLDGLLACMQVLDEAIEIGARFPSA